MNSAFDLQLSHPSGPLAHTVQGLWAASVSPVAADDGVSQAAVNKGAVSKGAVNKDRVEKTLFADAGSGIGFLLAGDAAVDGHALPQGVIMLPINKHADRLSLSPGCILAGVRFQPGMGYNLFGRHYQQLTRLAESEDQCFSLYPLLGDLQRCSNNPQRIERLYHWANQHCLLEQQADSIAQLLTLINNDSVLSQLSHQIDVSQRQAERLFKTRLGMTAKNYQRIIRIRQAIAEIKANPEHSLADIAANSGFSDQAHMTREFKAIARMTPGKLNHRHNNGVK